MERVVKDLGDVADVIAAGSVHPTRQWAEELWGAIDSAGRAMRKAGYPKSQFKTQKGKPGNQGSLPLG
jgi:hypothetical protein